MFLIIKVSVRIVKALPMLVVITLARALGWFLRCAVRFRREVIVSNIQAAYGTRKSAQEIRQLIRDTYFHMMLLSLEILRLPGITREKILEIVVTREGQEHLQKALERGKGAFILTGHVGNWELSGILLGKMGYSMHAVTKGVKSKSGSSFLKMLRDDNGLIAIPRENAARRILSILRQNGVIAFMIDQNMIHKEGVFVDFFGHPACTLPSLAILAARSGAPILPGYCYRDKDLRHYHGVLLPEIELEYPHESKEQNIIHNTQRFSNAVEAMIDRFPVQWTWMHKRWKTRPKDEDESACPFPYWRK